MTKEEARILHRAMSQMIEEYDVDLEEYQSSAIEDYLGRDMYGEETHALKFNSYSALLRAVMTFPELLFDKNKDPISQHQLISHFRFDNLGYSMILY